VAAHRIRRQVDAEAIGHALTLIPSGIRRRLAHVRFIAGVDPVFIGLHRFAETGDRRSYRDTAHAVYPCHLTNRPADDRGTGVVLPVPQDPEIVVHELGHALHEAIGFDCHTPTPVTEYAKTDTWEAFAEAFTVWVCPHAYSQQAADTLAQDARTLALFAELDR
jgi:hypothetical protein